jgi:hypothetical protein
MASVGHYKPGSARYRVRSTFARLISTTTTLLSGLNVYKICDDTLPSRLIEVLEALRAPATATAAA